MPRWRDPAESHPTTSNGPGHSLTVSERSDELARLREPESATLLRVSNFAER